VAAPDDAGISDAGPGGATVTCRAPTAFAAANLGFVGDLGPTDSGGGDSGPVRPLAGSATFAVTSTGVDLSISVTGCAGNVGGTGYAISIHEGPDCSDAGLQSPGWDVPRGEGITNLHCTGTTGVGLDYYTRADTDPKPWTIGGPDSSNLLGHVVVVQDPTTMAPVACGTIGAAPGDAGSSARTLPAITLAELTGICLFQNSPLRSGADAGCPDPVAMAVCGCDHCNLSACLGTCSDYLTCAEQQPDACTSGCVLDAVCGACLSNMTQCIFGFCPGAVSCAPALIDGGACAQLEACCATQRDGGDAPCLAVVRQIEPLGGDVNCASGMHDWDFVTHFASNPPCDFDQ
jgi:hypothetical protein